MKTTGILCRHHLIHEELEQLFQSWGMWWILFLCFEVLLSYFISNLEGILPEERKCQNHHLQKVRTTPGLRVAWGTAEANGSLCQG